MAAAGPERVEKILRQALAAGADAAVRVGGSDLDFCDSVAAGRALGAALGAMEYDIVLCGDAGADFGGSCVGATIAALLKLPAVSRIAELEIGKSAENARVVARRKNRALTYLCRLPAVFTVSQGRPCAPAPVNRIRWANREEIPVLDAKSLRPDLFENEKSGLSIQRYTHPKPREKRSVGVPPELPPAERFARVLYGGISARKGRTVVEGSTPREAEKLYEWLVREKILSE